MQPNRPERRSRWRSCCVGWRRAPVWRTGTSACFLATCPGGHPAPPAPKGEPGPLLGVRYPARCKGPIRPLLSPATVCEPTSVQTERISIQKVLPVFMLLISLLSVVPFDQFSCPGMSHVRMKRSTGSRRHSGLETGTPQPPALGSRASRAGFVSAGGGRQCPSHAAPHGPTRSRRSPAAAPQ